MGSRYSVLIATGQVTAEDLLRATGVAAWDAACESPLPIPVGFAPPDEAWSKSGPGWSAVVCGYGVGATSGANASRVAQALGPSVQLAYFAREDTNAEISAQIFNGGTLTFSHFEQAGEVDGTRSVGGPPIKDRYGQTDSEALLAGLFPVGVSFTTLEIEAFSNLRIRWVAEPPKRRWWQWR